LHVVGQLETKHRDELTEQRQSPPRDEQANGNASKRDHNTFGHEQTD
jgi:hypothetical protein